MTTGTVFDLLVLLLTATSCSRTEATSSSSDTNASIAAAPPAPATSEIAVPFISKVDARWATFDALPVAQRSKTQFQAALSDMETLIVDVPTSAQPLVADHAMTLARQHYSAWSTVGTTTAGDKFSDLVPNKNSATCQLWGSMWVSDMDTLSTIVKLGFLRITCPKKIWILKDEIAVCYLWSIDSDNPGEKMPAIVWSDLNLFRTAQTVGKRTDEQAPLALMGLMSKGGNIFIAGKKASIVETGPDWFRLTGDGLEGYVSPELCHHTAKK